MAENLIINGVDHAKFDLEWAKHGGCCIFDDSTDVYKQLILGKQVEERFIGAQILIFRISCEHIGAHTHL